MESRTPYSSTFHTTGRTEKGRKRKEGIVRKDRERNDWTKEGQDKKSNSQRNA